MSAHTEEQIREAFFRLHDNASGRTARSYMSIPPDPKRDADLILVAAIDELVELRAKMTTAVDALEACEDALDVATTPIPAERQFVIDARNKTRAALAKARGGK